MVKFINKIPAGNFLVPMILSAILFTLWPTLFHIGGPTQAAFTDSAVNFIVAGICFCSGVGIDLRKLGPLLKRHGVLLLFKLVIGVVLSFGFLALFGQSGIFGISALAFIVAINSINPAVYISLVNNYGTENDASAFGFTGLFSIPAVPMMIYSFASGGGFDPMPIVSTILPLAMGIILGNLDPQFKSMFGAGIGVLIPFLGWNIGQSINLIEAAQSGVYGVILAVVYYFIWSTQFKLDEKILKNDGVVGLSMVSVAGLSASTPAVLAQMNPALEPFVTAATAQILTAVVITSIITPILVKRQFVKNYGQATLDQHQNIK